MLKKTLELEDILPPKPEFILNEKTYSLRAPNQLDRVWFQQNFGHDKAVWEAIQKQDWLTIARVVYRLFGQESRADFKAQKAVVVNDEGHEKEVELTGPETLLVSIKGSTDGAKILAALNRAMINSEPQLEADFIAEVKKNLPELNRLLDQSTTEKSSTPSNTPTGGRKRKSQG